MTRVSSSRDGLALRVVGAGVFAGAFAAFLRAMRGSVSESPRLGNAIPCSRHNGARIMDSFCARVASWVRMLPKRMFAHPCFALLFAARATCPADEAKPVAATSSLDSFPIL